MFTVGKHLHRENTSLILFCVVFCRRSNVVMLLVVLVAVYVMLQGNRRPPMPVPPYRATAMPSISHSTPPSNSGKLR